MLRHNLGLTAIFILIGACASDGPGTEDKNPDALIHHDWDAQLSDGGMLDVGVTPASDLGEEDASDAGNGEVGPACDPAFGTTFDINPGEPLIVAVKFVEISGTADDVLSNPAVRTQVNQPFQATFTETFGSVPFTFDSVLTVSVGQDDVVRAVGKVAWKEGQSELVEQNVDVCLTVLGDFLTYDFEIEGHKLHVQFYTRKDS